MTEVCLVGSPDVALREDLLAYETARHALSTYGTREPYENSLVVETISLGQAVSLLNDLDWYLARLVDAAFVREPSIHAEEWLSRSLAAAVRDGGVDPGDTGDLLKVYGVVRAGDRAEGADGDGGNPGDDAAAVQRPADAGPTNRLVEPMYVRRVEDRIPEYDLRDVADTVVVRVTESEFG